MKMIAVLITCYNRQSKTLACLESLYKQEVQSNANIQVYLVDDGSTDGTREAVQSIYPETKILIGDGNLFWNGGMRLAFAEALKTKYDYYLWLNDDTLLEPSAICSLLATHQTLTEQGHPDSIIAGSTKDAVTGQPTYGGAMRIKRWHSSKFAFVEPSEIPEERDTVFGNCVLIPHSVAEKVGNLDPVFTHSHGDVDYGLRARQLGCSVWSAPGYVGTCSKNSVRGSWADTNLPLHERLRKAFQPKAFPIRAWTIFVRRHLGPFWIITWILPYVRSVIGYRDLNVSTAFGEEVEQQNSNV
jgi:GT2 family glycosyltransferase